MANMEEHLKAGAGSYAALLGVGGGLLLFKERLEIEVPWNGTQLAAGALIGFALAVGFALFPDMDIKSKPQRLFYRALALLDIGLIGAFHWTGETLYLLGAAYLGLAAMTPLFGKHRGWTHSRIAMILLPSPLLLAPMLTGGEAVWIGLPLYISAVTGYASHLYKDGLLFRLR